MTDITMPALSPTMEEGNLAKWHVKVGDTVEPGQVIAEIETDNATMEVEAVDEGVIEALLVEEGAQGVKVNTPIARLKGDGEAKPAPSESRTASPPAGEAPPKAAEGGRAGQSATAPSARTDNAPHPPTPAPRGGGGVIDYIGAFAVTAGIGEEAIAHRFKRANDDYSAILAQALCDRLAEAFAEALHAKVRRELWGHAKDESLTYEELIEEKYRGIRPAPGYPAQPDHTEKRTIFELLDAPTIGIDLTESMAMTPPSSVSGLYFAHPDAEYFGVGKIDRDQVADYARRKGWDLATAERWLAPILAYDPKVAKAS